MVTIGTITLAITKTFIITLCYYGVRLPPLPFYHCYLPLASLCPLKLDRAYSFSPESETYVYKLRLSKGYPLLMSFFAVPKNA